VIAALAAPWIALALGLGATVSIALALRARSLVMSVLAMLAGAALIAASLIAFGHGDAALAQALVGVGLAPPLLLAALLLSMRTIKLKRARAPWFALVFAALIALILFGALLESGPRLAHDVSRATHTSVLGFAPLMLALAISCLALLGFGERGALDHPPAGRGP
jgi:hypothetical protein